MAFETLIEPYLPNANLIDDSHYHNSKSERVGSTAGGGGDALAALVVIENIVGEQNDALQKFVEISRAVTCISSAF